MNVRASWSQSVSRPEFRELAPAEFPAQRGERSQFGNPLLIAANITNYDMRWEWFLSPLELMSLSFFYKKLENPIEKVAILAGPEIAETWLNAESATLKGFEFEVRKNLGFIRRQLAPVTFDMNATYIDSSVSVPRQEIFGLPTQQTVTERRLVDAAPYIINASVEYAKPDLFTARLLYLTYGPTITAAGSVGVPDTILQRRNQLDAVLLVPMKRWLGQNVNMRLTAENLLNDPFLFTVGGEPQRRFAAGVKFTVGLSYSY
jgi:outer membrane receptor protein involved in Fe transport